MPVMRTAVVIPSLGAPTLPACLGALAQQTRPPERVVVALSGNCHQPDHGHRAEYLTDQRRLGFAASVNRGVRSVIDDVDAVAVLNDDAEPGAAWLSTLAAALDALDDAGAVQGTVTTASGTAVDGRGIVFGRFGLPKQVDRGRGAEEIRQEPQRRVGVSATAALFRCHSLKDAALENGQFFDERFDSYHEDVDLALRLWRIGRQAYWVPGALCLHHGSKTGRNLSWMHSWWVLANRWRALSGNLTVSATVRLFPEFARGEIRAVRTLARHNPRAWIVSLLVTIQMPLLIARGWMRKTPGPRLDALPRVPT